MTVTYDIIVGGNNLSLCDGFLGLANVTLVHSPGGLLLFDTGHYVNRSLLLAGLARHGVEPADVKTVFLSHLHFDHCLNIDLFPTAAVYVSRAEWDYAAAPNPKDLFIPWMIREKLEEYDLNLIEGEGSLCEGIRYFPTPGHTPGSYSLVLETETGPAVLAGDAVKYVKEILTGVSDMPFGTVEDSRKSISRVTDLAERIVPGHFPELVKRKGRFVWDEGSEFNLVIR